MPARWSGRWVPLALILLVAWLGGCAVRAPAPVETREDLPPAQSAPRGDYQVQVGETLYSIAWRYNLDYVTLAYWNGIAPPYRIQAGQWLRLRPQPQDRLARERPLSRAPEPPASPPITPRPPVTSRPAGSTPRPPRQDAPQSSPTAAKMASSPPSPDTKGAARKTNRSPRRAGRLAWTWPTRGKVVRTFRQDDQTRRGIRISGRAGQPVVAAEGGRVVYSGSGLVGYGQLIIIKHDNNYLSAYGLNDRLLAREGEAVGKGDKVAEMGRSVDGKPLLHFEIRHRGGAVDPLRLLPRR